MKHPVRILISLPVALKELEQVVRRGENIRTGRPFSNFGDMRPRELLANWLLCAVLNTRDDEFFFTTDPIGGDGLICHRPSDRIWQTEHVAVIGREDTANANVEDLIVEQITAKVTKGGAEYARGKSLVVFVEHDGCMWFPNRINPRLPKPLHFTEVWALGLKGVLNDRYVYYVAAIGSGEDYAEVWEVEIDPTFETWTVRQIQ